MKTIVRYSQSVSEETGYRLAGLTEGEGHFSISGTNKSGYKLCFKIKLRIDDTPLLEWAKNETKLGTIHYGKAWRTDGANRQAWSCWTVHNKHDLMCLVDLFDAYPLIGKKSREYTIWREAVIDWFCHGPGDSWEPIAKAHDDLRTAREFKEALR